MAFNRKSYINRPFAKSYRTDLSVSDELNIRISAGGIYVEEYKNGVKYHIITILHPDYKADISYYGTEYTDFPLPRLIFGFHISDEGRISGCRLGVVGNENNLKPAAPMFMYPFSNVSGTRLCIGNNTLPRVQSLHTLGSLTYHILSMDNNNDHFRPSNNKLGLELPPKGNR